MRLLPDWKRLLRKAWSVKLSLLAGTLSAAEVGIYLVASTRPTPWLALGAALMSLAAAVARIVAQQEFRRGD
jgi:uncharacterized membrane protein YccC